MKIVFMGTPVFAKTALEALVNAGYEIPLVITQPDKPKGRGKEVQFPPVKECALAHPFFNILFFLLAYVRLFLDFFLDYIQLRFLLLKHLTMRHLVMIHLLCLLILDLSCRHLLINLTC